MRDIPSEHEIYRHFKGNLYEILAIARQTEAMEELVIYRDVHDHSRVFARPLAMFMSQIDKEKYPDAKDTYRFTRVDDNIDIAPDIEPDDIKDVKPLLIKFLDADTYEDKLDLLLKMRGDMDDETINAIAVSLDTEIKPGTADERFSELKSYILMMEKYECNRLR